MFDEGWAREAVAELRGQDGFTFHPTFGSYEGKGYGVATYPERSLCVDLQRTLASQLTHLLAAFARSNADLLEKPGHYVGGWRRSPRELVLDISIVTDSRAMAAELRDRYNQTCFYEFDGVNA